MNLDRNLKVDHTTIYRWVQKYAPELEQRVLPHLRKGGISYRIDETYIKIKGIWHFLYRAIDSYGDTIDCILSPKRNASVAFRFFRKMLGSYHSSKPKVISADKNKIVLIRLHLRLLKKFTYLIYLLNSDKKDI